MTEITYRFAPVDPTDDGSVQLADDPRMALLAMCVASQQSAGFKDYLDIRQVRCPDCKSAGFNTGWGYWRFICGAAILTDGEPDAPCGGPLADAPPAHCARDSECLCGATGRTFEGEYCEHWKTS